VADAQAQERACPAQRPAPSPGVFANAAVWAESAGRIEEESRRGRTEAVSHRGRTKEVSHTPLAGPRPVCGPDTRARRSRERGAVLLAGVAGLALLIGVSGSAWPLDPWGSAVALVGGGVGIWAFGRLERS